MKNLYLTFILIFSLSLSVIIWPNINLPPQDFVINSYDFNENYNKNNDTVRFIVFILLSLLPFLYGYLRFYKKDVINIDQLLNIKFNRNKLSIRNNFFYLTSILVSGCLLQFLIIDFESFISQLDLFHEGIWLTASSNYLLTKNFWVSSYIDRGFFGTFSPLIIWEILDTQSIGAMRLSNLILLLLCKISLIFLAKKISNNLDFTKQKKIIFFLLLSICLLTLVSFINDGQFVRRSFLTIIFLNIVIDMFQKKNSYNLHSFLVGFFSVLSFLWWLDIAVYINLIIILLFIFFIIRKDYRILISITFGIIVGWLSFIIYFPKSEIVAFFTNSYNVFLTVDQIQGLVYPFPFFSGDTRATKTLLYFVIGGVFTILICFNSKNKFNSTNKIFFLFLFILSLVSFKTGLSRSDSAHIKTSIGPLMIVLYSYIIYFFLIKLNSKTINVLNGNIIIKLSVITFIIFFFTDFNPLKIYNLKDFPNKINNLVNSSNERFINKKLSDYKEFINYYKKISINDDCVQVLTDDVALPFLMNKKSCTKYYQTWVTQPYVVQRSFVEDLSKSKPEIILSKSDLHSEYNLKIIKRFLDKNYAFHSKYSHWTFLKKIK